ncbi:MULTISPECIES: hypothetical protein [unclassified Chromobacterium]|uniref:hypothetical protein n=1 Tax=unclassified Chromobacterium TaxID=2641838 RepID=UPI0035103997
MADLQHALVIAAAGGGGRFQGDVGEGGTGGGQQGQQGEFFHWSSLRIKVSAVAGQGRQMRMRIDRISLAPAHSFHMRQSVAESA